MEELVGNEERANRLIAMGQMAATLAHEIRNPLGSMELFLTLLKKDLGSKPESLNLVEQIHSGIKTLDRIISNCLQFARDTKPRKREVSDISEFLVESLSFVRERAKNRNVQLKAVIQGDGLLFIDRYLMGQVILNLLVNALDAVEDRQEREKLSPSAHFEPLVTIECDLRDEDIWRLRVQDNGGGISEEVKQSMFDPFISTKSKGTGLGLAIVLSITAAHGGRVLVNSERGVGTIMTLELPRSITALGNQ